LVDIVNSFRLYLNQKISAKSWPRMALTLSLVGWEAEAFWRLELIQELATPITHQGTAAFDLKAVQWPMDKSTIRNSTA